MSAQLENTDQQRDFHGDAEETRDAVDEGREGEADNEIIQTGSRIENAQTDQQRDDAARVCDARGQIGEEIEGGV